jgi:hypothetical protein
MSNIISFELTDKPPRFQIIEGTDDEPMPFRYEGPWLKSSIILNHQDIDKAILSAGISKVVPPGMQAGRRGYYFPPADRTDQGGTSVVLIHVGHFAVAQIESVMQDGTCPPHTRVYVLQHQHQHQHQ